MLLLNYKMEPSLKLQPKDEDFLYRKLNHVPQVRVSFCQKIWIKFLNWENFGLIIKL